MFADTKPLPSATTSILDKIRRSELLSSCRKMWVDNGCDSCAKGDENCGPTNGCKCHYPGGCDSPNWQSTFQDFYNLHQSPNVWTKFARTDFWDCDSVDRNIDEQQCTWFVRVATCTLLCLTKSF